MADCRSLTQGEGHLRKTSSKFWMRSWVNMMTGSTVERLACPLDQARLGPNTVAMLAGVILLVSAF